MPSPYVYQYLWRDFSLPTHRSWIFTLTGNQNIAFLASITVTITHVEGRTWTVLRDSFIFLKRNRVHLADEVVDEKEATLSQFEAIRILLQRLRRHRDAPADSIQSISYWFGVIATFNMFAFIGNRTPMDADRRLGGTSGPVREDRLMHRV